MTDQAVGLRPKLFLRALELAGGREAEAEDLVQDAYLAMLTKPPRPKTPTELHRWLRVVLRNRNALRWREFRGVEVVSYEALEEHRR